MNFFLGHSMNIFLGLTGVQEFFSFNFPLREFFLYFARPPPPPPPISFLMVRPLYIFISWLRALAYEKFSRGLFRACRLHFFFSFCLLRLV